MPNAPDDQSPVIHTDDPLAVEEHERAVDPRDNTSEASRVPEPPAESDRPASE